MTDVDLSEEALLRIPVGVAGERVGAIPTAPAGPCVTASFSSPAVASQHAETLRLLGYRVVGAETPRLTMDDAPAPALHVLVPGSAREGDPVWWQRLTALADGTYSLAFGPVQASFREVLRAHLEPPR